MIAVTNLIRGVLSDHLTGLVGLPVIAFENVHFVQDKDVPYVRAVFMPTSRRAAVRGPDPHQRYQGLFRITLCYPENVGPGAVMDMCDAVLSHFDASTIITAAGVDLNVSIDYSEAGQGYPEPPFFCVPITVGWYAYA